MANSVPCFCNTPSRDLSLLAPPGSHDADVSLLSRRRRRRRLMLATDELWASDATRVRVNETRPQLQESAARSLLANNYRSRPTRRRVDVDAINEIRRRVSSSSAAGPSHRATGDDDRRQIYGRTVGQVTGRSDGRRRNRAIRRATDTVGLRRSPTVHDATADR